MSSLFSGVNLALRALQANQQAIEVIEHNVANANTSGYRRQSIVLNTSIPYSPSDLDHGHTRGLMGTGVQVDQIKRIASSFVDARFRSENSDASRWEAQSNALHPLESLLAETKDTGLIQQMDQFFNQWQAVSTDPLNTGNRQVLLENAAALTTAFQQRAAQMDATQADLNTEISQQASSVNDLAGQIAAMNQAIAERTNDGSQPNDLLDQRDMLLDQLSQITSVSSFQQTNGEGLVSVGGHVLVDSNQAYKLNVTFDTNSGMPTVNWDDGQVASITSGQLAGLMSARTQVLPGLRSNLDALAAKLIKDVNDVHVTGFGLDNIDGRNFFSGTDAGTIQLDSAVAGHPERVASAAAANQPGDNAIAQKIAALADDKRMNGNSQTFGQFYNSQVTGLANDIQKATANASQHQSAVSAINAQRESISGVSLDEEAANLVRYQRAYQAATRVMNAVDEMLDRVINNMGLVGR